MKHSSLKLSKFLQERGFEGEWESCLAKPGLSRGGYYLSRSRPASGDYYPAYDILNDLCVRYAVSVFGKKYHKNRYSKDDRGERHYTKNHTEKVLNLLQQGKQDEAEEYIMEHTILTK